MNINVEIKGEIQSPKIGKVIVGLKMEGKSKGKYFVHL